MYTFRAFGILFLLFAVLSLGQIQSAKSDVISGILFDENGNPAAGIEILNLSNNFVAVSKEKGEFSIRGNKHDKLQINFPHHRITVEANKIKGLKIYLKEEIKKEINNPRIPEPVILEDAISSVASYSVEKELEGRVAGVKITSAEAESSVKIRGAASISDSKPSNSDLKAGQLTAGEVNDFSHWDYWQDLAENELEQYKGHWNLNPATRFSVILTNKNGNPIINKIVHLKNSTNEILWTARTDNTGRAELWLNPQNISENNSTENLKITDDSNRMITSNAIKFKKGLNLFQYDENCKELNKVNIAFMVDATGSMGDELRYLQAELYDVIERTKNELPQIELTMGSVFYRDNGDEYTVKNFDFTDDISNVISFIKKQSAGGGGDYPEAVVEALDASLNGLRWDDDAGTKLLFVLLDAPPHHSPENLVKLQNLAETAAKKGIRIIPIAASGIDKSTEFLMRALALESNGTYLFLTDHSGIGNAHLEPSTESYKVEMFNDMLLRIILQFTETKTCFKTENYPVNSQMEDKISNDSKIDWSYSPNPTTGIVNVKIDRDASEIYLLDTTGKLIFYQDKKSNSYQLNLSGLPTAVYYLKVIVDGKELYGKLIKK